jgi:hypothetical protein
VLGYGKRRYCQPEGKQSDCESAEHLHMNLDAIPEWEL